MGVRVYLMGVPLMCLSHGRASHGLASQRPASHKPASHRPASQRRGSLMGIYLIGLPLIPFNTTMIFEMVTEPLFGESDPKSSKSRGIQQYAGAYCRNFKAKGKAAAKV